MKSIGILRPVDEVGRLVIPKPVRTRLGLTEDDPIEIYVENDKIILTKYTDSCTFCGSREDLGVFKDKKVCKACIEELKK